MDHDARVLGLDACGRRSGPIDNDRLDGEDQDWRKFGWRSIDRTPRVSAAPFGKPQVPNRCVSNDPHFFLALLA
jgi:hypothetical protein